GDPVDVEVRRGRRGRAGAGAVVAVAAAGGGLDLDREQHRHGRDVRVVGARPDRSVDREQDLPGGPLHAPGVPLGEVDGLVLDVHAEAVGAEDVAGRRPDAGADADVADDVDLV